MDDNIVITGRGIVCSLGTTPDDIWNSLLSSESGIRPLGGLNTEGFSCQAAALAPSLDLSAIGVPKRDSRIMGKHSCMLIKGARDAYQSAGIGETAISGEDVGFFAGMGMVDYEIESLLASVVRSLDDQGNLDYDRFYSSGYREIYPLWPLSMLNNISFCQAAIGLDIRGENTVFSPHADSGAQAIAEGVRTVLEKKARVVIAGGVSEVVSPLSLARAGVFSVLNEAAGKSGLSLRPFGTDRSGTLLGEGCAMVCLESRSSADTRGVSYSTMVIGFGFACEPEANGPAPTIDAMSQAMKAGIESAGLRPEDIDLIIAHGDGTIKGDGNEAEAIRNVFHACPDKIIVYSSKAALGNLLAAGPAADVIIGSCIIEHGVVPAIAGLAESGTTSGLRVVVGNPLRARPKRIMINAFSYEGQCASLVIEAAK